LLLLFLVVTTNANVVGDPSKSDDRSVWSVTSDISVTSDRVPFHAAMVLEQLSKETIFLCNLQMDKMAPQDEMTESVEPSFDEDSWEPSIESSTMQDQPFRTKNAPKTPVEGPVNWIESLIRSPFLKTGEQELFLGQSFLSVKKADKDDPKCKNAPKMSTALILQIFLPGGGFASMGRWEWFAGYFSLFLSQVFMLFCMQCWAGLNKPFANGEIGAMCCTLCLMCLVAFAVSGIFIWSLVVIADRSLLCGNGCPLQT